VQYPFSSNPLYGPSRYSHDRTVIYLWVAVDVVAVDVVAVGGIGVAGLPSVGLVSDGLVSDGLLSDGLLSVDLVSDGLLPINLVFVSWFYIPSMATRHLVQYPRLSYALYGSAQ